MSDSTRQSLTDRVVAAVTPDSQKSETTILSETARGKIDKAQAYMEPESEKSYMQKAADSIRDMSEGSNTTGLHSKVDDIKESIASTMNTLASDPYTVTHSHPNDGSVFGK